MSRDRLDKGFVTWQGRRVFVPWFGAPRIVPAAQDEVRVVKLRFRAHVTVAILFIPFLAIGVWLGDPQGFSGAMVGVSVVFGIEGALEQRYVRRWPVLMASRGARARFMLGYFRSLRIMERWNALIWVGLAAIICLPPIVISAAVIVGSFPEPVFLIRATIFLVGPGVLGFLALRHAATVLVSLIPPFRRARSAAS